MGPPGALWPIPLETHTRPDSVLAIQTPQVRAHGAVLGAPTTRLTGRGEVERFTGRDGLGLDDAGIGIADLGKRMLAALDPLRVVRDLAQHQQLGVLRRRRTCQQRHPPGQADEDQVEHP